MPEFLANSLITFYVLCSGSLKTRLILPGLGMEWLAVCNGSAYYKLSESLGCRKRAHMKPKTRAKVEGKQASLWIETAFFSFKEHNKMKYFH